MTYTSDQSGSVYENDMTFLTIHPGQGAVAEKAARVAAALNAQEAAEKGRERPGYPIRRIGESIVHMARRAV